MKRELGLERVSNDDGHKKWAIVKPLHRFNVGGGGKHTDASRLPLHHCAHWVKTCAIFLGAISLWLPSRNACSDSDLTDTSVLRWQHPQTRCYRTNKKQSSQTNRGPIGWSHWMFRNSSNSNVLELLFCSVAGPLVGAPPWKICAFEKRPHRAVLSPQDSQTDKELPVKMDTEDQCGNCCHLSCCSFTQRHHPQGQQLVYG